MDTNKMREAFEADFVEEMCRRGGEGFRSTVLHSLSQRKPDGDYQHITESLAWWAWQASREAVVVEPVWPDHYDYTNSDVAGAAVLDCRTAFQKAMKAQGLKVTP
ncbi:hypothetical protein [Pseudomonas protegens]|uniref:hypothetical protein n=1 Tax=Pseudomonas protegens TaxID=380021 RepID=UPI001B3209FC|nr:hypothetical protein [Pseudomonas protegens]